MNSYKDLIVWQKSVDFAVKIYHQTEKFPRSELYGLTDQLRRASIAIPSNIAEGFCRRGRASYVNHLSIALGSEAELETQIEIARRLGYLLPADADVMIDDLQEVGRMLNGLITSLERSAP